MRYTSIFSQWVRSSFAFLLSVFFAVNALAIPQTDHDAKLLLILNSYHEDEQWGNTMAQPITLHLARVDSVECDQVYLNNSTITDQASYDAICDNVFNHYANHHPDYLVLIGNFAFTLRDRIKAEWGDIPFLLISRIDTYAPTEDYFVSLSDDFAFGPTRNITSLRDQFNFTAVIVPDNYTKTIDLMFGLMPDIKEFVYMSDAVYVNRLVANGISNYLAEKHPTVQFNWLKASEKTSVAFQRDLAYRHPDTGFLLSSWVYETESTRGYPVLTNNDLKLLSGSVNPIFTLRESYINMGPIGGVFTDNGPIVEDVLEVIGDMLDGKSMQDMPFYIPNETVTRINYHLLKEYGLSEKNCPPHTVFFAKTPTFWEKNWILIVLVLGVALLVIFLVQKHSDEVRKKKEIVRRHNEFLDAMPMPFSKAVVVMDNDNIKSLDYKYKNTAMLDLLKSNTAADNALYLFPLKFINERLHELVKNGESLSFTYHFDETNTYYEFFYVLVGEKKIGPNISQYEVDVFALDNTKRMLVEKGMKEAADTLDLIIDISKQVPWQWDLQRDKIIFTNKDIFYHEIGESSMPQKLSYAEYLDYILPEDEEKFKNIHRDIVSGKISAFKVQYRVKNEESNEGYEWVENYGAVTERDASGQPVRMLGSSRVITEQKDEEQRVAAALVKANESDRMKSAFLANMSHEIRTPLNAILGFSNILVRTESQEKRDELFSIISRNNDLLLNLINDVLDLAKIESNTIDINYTVCDIVDLLESIGKTMSIRIPQGVKLNIVKYSEKCVVEADSSRLAQVMINLLTNACKFTKRGSITMGFEILEDDGLLYFFVKDTGIGIAKENLDRVFQQFVKLNNFAQGTGLGLAISRSLVEKMGGEIGVDSAGLGRGTKFWFTIPYKPRELEGTSGHVDAESIANSRVVVAEEDKTVEMKEFVNGKPIMLVAEDNESNYWLIEHLLGEEYNLVPAENGQIAVDLFKKYNPDIVVMDINMPVMDGYGAVAEMRKLSTTVPIIAVTAYAFASDRARILNSGFDAYVPKPITEASIKAAISKVMLK